MKIKRYLLGLIAFFYLLVAFQSINSELFFIPENWEKPIYDVSKNPISAEKVALGRALFYDPILSRDSSVSCDGCHSPYNGFAHSDHDLSHGINDQIGNRNAPALMNLAWQKSFMWDGAIQHLDMQALAPISHPKEMGENIHHVVEKLQKSQLYPLLFYKAYLDSTITGENVLKALSQFQLTLISAQSKYDSVQRKESTFTPQEANGYLIFQKKCASCHQEPLFTNQAFANNGLAIDPSLKDLGRMNITQNTADSLKFKVPTLRNIEFTYPYMHDGRFKNLSQVINHYTKGVQKSETLAPELNLPLEINSNEKVDLMSFLLTLSDKNFIFNPNFAYPKNIFRQTKEKK